MYALSIAVEVNPPGFTPVLSRDDVWRGLVAKANDAVPFVPGMTRCEVVEDLPQGFWREVEFRGERFRERITLTAPVQVLFEREPDTPNAGWITNVVSELGGRLILTFTFAVRFAGTAEGSPEEAAAGAQMRGAYEAAVTATLDRVRSLVDERATAPRPMS